MQSFWPWTCITCTRLKQNVIALMLTMMMASLSFYLIFFFLVWPKAVIISIARLKSKNCTHSIRIEYSTRRLTFIHIVFRHRCTALFMQLHRNKFQLPSSITIWHLKSHTQRAREQLQVQRRLLSKFKVTQMSPRPSEWYSKHIYSTDRLISLSD